MPGPEHEQGTERADHQPAPAQTVEAPTTDVATDIASAEAGVLSPDGAERLQRTAGNAAVASMVESAQPTPGDLVRSVIDEPGRPLDSSTSSLVSDAVGRDVSGIRVHDGPSAAASAQAVEADMFMSGNHLVAPGGVDVTTDEGLFKTVHEATHFAQQSAGAVDGTMTDDGLSISDPSDRFEQAADAAGSQAVAARAAGGGMSAGGF